MNQITFVKDF